MFHAACIVHVLQVLTHCLRGLQNILRVTKEVPPERLGALLAAVRVNRDSCAQFLTKPTNQPE